jgi:hypothetical protein
MERTGQWDSGSLVEHLRTKHRDERESIETMYPEMVSDVYSGGSDDDDGAGGIGLETDRGGGDPINSEIAEQTPTDDHMDDAYGKKWYLIGVGGAGNNILDAILLRRDTLEENHEQRAVIWNGGLAGYGSLNTNISELEQTYYAQEEHEYSRNDLLPNCIIGFGKHDYAGAGFRWDLGRDLIEADFEDGANPFKERWDIKQQHLRDSQAIMFIHSVTKGTGCGATPVLAEKIREHVLDDEFVVQKPFFSSIVLPSRGRRYADFGGRAKVNGIVGLTRASKAVDAIIPFDNQRLDSVKSEINPRINRLDEYNPPQYKEINKPLVAFLEAFTMSSVPQFLDREATMSIMGDVFDPADSFRPVQDKYQVDPEREYTPAVILAPVLGRMRADSFDRSKLEILARNALFQNKLAEFDPTTAWGGTFLLYGPNEKMREISQFVNDGVISDILAGDEFLDADAATGSESIDIHVNQLVTPYLDDVFLWGTLWNPKMPPLEEMYEHAQKLKQDGNSEQAENIRDVWSHIEPLFSCLGRDNMP